MIIINKNYCWSLQRPQENRERPNTNEVILDYRAEEKKKTRLCEENYVYLSHKGKILEIKVKTTFIKAKLAWSIR